MTTALQGSISTLAIIIKLADIPDNRQIWYADDAGYGGVIEGLKAWWDKLSECGPPFGYFPEASKTRLVTKPQFYDKAKAVFENSGVQITSEGRRYVGAAIGTQDFKASWVKTKVEKWIKELQQLIPIAKCEPQLAYSAYVVGLCKRWMFIMRTMKDISHLLEPLDKVITNEFLPCIINFSFSQTEREIFGLPAKYGGLGVFVPSEISKAEYQYSRTATLPLVETILQQRISLAPDESLKLFEVTGKKKQVSQKIK